MGKSQKVSDPSPGDDKVKKVFSEAEFKKMVSNDIKFASALLQSISTDQNTMNHLAEFLYGRYQNNLHSEELKKQVKLDLDKKA